MQIYENVLLSTILWYQIGGVARIVIDVSSKDDLYEALEYVKNNNVSKVFILGLGSNLLFSDDGFDGAIIRFQSQDDGNGIRMLSTGSDPAQGPTLIVETFAGEFLDSVIQAQFELGLVGLEWAGGLPGTVGAAIRGNVGAFGREVKDIFVKAHCIRLKSDGSYEEITLNKDEMEFSYRSSKVKTDKLIVVSVQFQLKQATPEELLNAKETYYVNITYRQEKHPLDYPNCGSVFKNISKKEEVERILESWPDIRELVEGKWHGKVSMGYVINRLGFAGQLNGAAQVSEKHQNFIVNKGGATASDVKGLIVEIEEEMQESFGFTPEVEIEIV